MVPMFFNSVCKTRNKQGRSAYTKKNHYVLDFTVIRIYSKYIYLCPLQFVAHIISILPLLRSQQQMTNGCKYLSGVIFSQFLDHPGKHICIYTLSNVQNYDGLHVCILFLALFCENLFSIFISHMLYF